MNFLNFQKQLKQHLDSIFSFTLIAKNMPKKDVIRTVGSPTALALAGSFQTEEDMSDVDEGSILSEALEEEISKILHEEDSDDEKPIQVEKIDIQGKGSIINFQNFWVSK